MSIPRKYLLLILGCFFLCTPELTLKAEGQTNDSAKVSLLGSGHGFDHVGIAVRDLETAKKTNRNLGFTVFGGENTLIWERETVGLASKVVAIWS